MRETRREIEAREEESLPAWALRSSRAARGRPLDPEGRLFDYRTEFQRDRDRVLNSMAFRRLRQKTDGGPASSIDLRRDRLTHTLEVTQLARTIARALELNEDLTEAIALGHDLGAPPYGAVGARALDKLLAGRRSSSRSGFSIPLQSLRVVDLLEKRYHHEGLNLTHDVREGIFKQARTIPFAKGRKPAPGSVLSGIEIRTLRGDGPPSLEAQAVSAADRIASTMGEMDDALRGGDLEPGALERVPLVRELLRRVGNRYPGKSRGKVTVKANLLHRGLTHLLVTSTIESSIKSLRAWCRARKVSTHEEFLDLRREMAPAAVSPGSRIARLLEGLRGAIRARVGAGAADAQREARTRKILGSLVELYTGDPRLLDDYVLIRFKVLAGGRFLRDLPPSAMETEIARRYHGSGVLLRLVGDHIAGMTDAYARFEFARLSGLATESEPGAPGP